MRSGWRATSRPGTRGRTWIAALCAVVLFPGCATGGATPEPRMGPDAAEAERLSALYRAQSESARNRFTPADVSFMTGMIGHHAQALAMTSLVPERSEDPEIRTLARRIDNAQRDEIRLMERWLRVRGEAVPSWTDEAHAHAGHADPGGLAGHAGHAGHAAEMPGMLTPDQMSELMAATGAEFDRLFLGLMIEHHQGAVVMVRRLLATDGAAQDTEVFRFASDVQVDQATEIARMEQMLRERG